MVFNDINKCLQEAGLGDLAAFVGGRWERTLRVEVSDEGQQQVAACDALQQSKTVSEDVAPRITPLFIVPIYLCCKIPRYSTLKHCLRPQVLPKS